MLKEVTLVDFYGFFFKNVLNREALKLTNSKGQVSGSMYFLLRSYYKLLDFKNVILCFDKVVYNRRKEIDSDYKIHRPEIMEGYKTRGYNIDLWKIEFIKSVPSFYCFNENMEADDVIYSLVKIFSNKYPNIVINIITKDEDLWRLKGNKNVRIFDFKYNEISSEILQKKYKLNDFRNIFWYKVIFGDSSDNIPSAIPKRTRKKKFIEFLNNNNYEDITKESILNKFEDVIDIERFDKNFELVRFIFRNDIYMKLYDGNKNEYNKLIQKYEFNKIYTFNDLYLKFLNSLNELVDKKSDIL